MSRPIIREILKEGTERINQRMLGNLPPQIEHRRSVISWIVIVAVCVIFASVLRRVFQTFRQPRQVAGTVTLRLEAVLHDVQLRGASSWSGCLRRDMKRR
jgi:hypothetical protein